VRQAAFIGVGSMVGAGIFALLGAAGAVAGAAVWLSFLLAGAVAILQGYSFAKGPASIVALVVILGLSIALDYWWKRARTGGAKHVQVAPSPMEQG
jgi:hypothetical protein